MYYDQRGNENNSNKSVGDVRWSANIGNSGGVCNTDGSILPTETKSKNLGIERNQIWAKADKTDDKFSMIKKRLTLKHKFGKYQTVIPTWEEWDKDLGFARMNPE